MKSAIAVFAVTATAFALPAAAQMNTSAFYVGGSVGQSKFKNSCTGLPAGFSCDEKDTAWRILGGYQFTPNIAAEVGYHNFGETKASSGGFEGEDKGRALVLVALGLSPLPQPVRALRAPGAAHHEVEHEADPPWTRRAESPHHPSLSA